MGRRRGYTVNLPCSFPGCRAFSHHEAETRADEARLRKSGTWRCDEHFRIESRLTPETPSRTTRLTNLVHPAPIFKGERRFFDGHHGMLSGPGFVVRAEDWPAGAILEVTARVIVPDATPDQGGVP